jgi:hypothetical protein
MPGHFFIGSITVGLVLGFVSQCNAADATIRRLTNSTNESAATLRVLADQPAPDRIPRFITGKFAEHLRENIYGGMSAEILRNPTLADYPFGSGDMNPDGVMKFHTDRQQIVRDLRQAATRWGWPESELDRLVSSHDDGLAAFWAREGAKSDVEPSPDTGPYGERAQRVQVKAAGQGIAQWTCLPLHRARKFEFEILARSPDLTSLVVSLTPPGTGKPFVSAAIKGLSPQWQTFKGALEVDATLPADAAYNLR